MSLHSPEFRTGGKQGGGAGIAGRIWRVGGIWTRDWVFKIVRTQPTDWESVFLYVSETVVPTHTFRRLRVLSPLPSPPSSRSRWWLGLIWCLGSEPTGREGLGRERKDSVASFGWGDGLGWRISQIIVKREQQEEEEGRRDVWDIIRSWIFFARYPRVVLYKLVSRYCFCCSCVCVCVCFFVFFWVFFLVNLEVCSLPQRV